MALQRGCQPCRRSRARARHGFTGLLRALCREHGNAGSESGVAAHARFDASLICSDAAVCIVPRPASAWTRALGSGHSWSHDARAQVVDPAELMSTPKQRCVCPTRDSPFTASKGARELPALPAGVLVCLARVRAFPVLPARLPHRLTHCEVKDLSDPPWALNSPLRATGRSAQCGGLSQAPWPTARFQPSPTRKQPSGPPSEARPQPCAPDLPLAAPARRPGP